jgi:hypothetical protein
MLPTQWQCPTRVHGAAADKGKTQENKTIEISSPNKTDRRKPRRSDRPVYMEINSALTPPTRSVPRHWVGAFPDWLTYKPFKQM